MADNEDWLCKNISALLIKEGPPHNHWGDDLLIYNVRRFTARSFCLYWYWIKSLWRTDSCPAAELQLHSKQKLLPPPTNEHYLNFELSRGQFLNVLIQENRDSSLKLSLSHLISAALCWNRQQTYFVSLQITLNNTARHSSQGEWKQIQVDIM